MQLSKLGTGLGSSQSNSVVPSATAAPPSTSDKSPLLHEGFISDDDDEIKSPNINTSQSSSSAAYRFKVRKNG